MSLWHLAHRFGTFVGYTGDAGFVAERIPWTPWQVMHCTPLDCDAVCEWMLCSKSPTSSVVAVMPYFFIAPELPWQRPHIAAIFSLLGLPMYPFARSIALSLSSLRLSPPWHPAQEMPFK